MDILKETKLFCIAAAMFIVAIVNGQVFYDEGSKTIKVSDFSSESPCTPAKLFEMSKTLGFGKVSYDKNSSTYTLDCNLQIGDNNETETYFQVASKETPNETLVINGNLLIAPYWIKGENEPDLWYKAKIFINRITLGVEGDPSVKASLKINCPKGVKRLIYAGYKLDSDNKVKRGFGGQIFAFNSRISPLSAASPAERIDNINLAGIRGISLVNSEISGVANTMLFGFNSVGQAPCRIENSIFSNGNMVINNGIQKTITGCTFKNMKTAISDSGFLDAVIENCKFESNENDWSLGFTDKGLTLLDCTFDKNKKNPIKSWNNPKTGKIQYPKLIVKYHAIVNVTDAAGKPLAGASIKIEPENKTDIPNVVENGTCATGATGQTPGKDSKKAVILTEFIKVATDTPNQPETTEMSYTVTASKDGKSNSVKGIKADQSWKTISIKL